MPPTFVFFFNFVSFWLFILFNYYFFNVEYYGLKIDAFASLPDDEIIELPQEINLTSEKVKEFRFNLAVNS